MGGYGVNLTESFRQPCAAGTKAGRMMNRSMGTSRCKDVQKHVGLQTMDDACRHIHCPLGL